MTAAICRVVLAVVIATALSSGALSGEVAVSAVLWAAVAWMFLVGVRDLYAGSNK